MKPQVRRTLERIREALALIDFPQKRNTQQTAICLYALLDRNPRAGLLPGKQYLNDGARIHDILEFAREELGIKVAENTRETYRKHSLKPLLDEKLITRFRSAVNDPNTHYVLNKSFEVTLRAYIVEEDEQRRKESLAKWRAAAEKIKPRSLVASEIDTVAVAIEGKVTKLSPGKHNLLIKDIVEIFAPIFIDSPKILLISDAEYKLKHVDPLAKKLGLRLDEHEKLPDTILYSTMRNIVFIVEAVTSAGVIDDARIRDIEAVILPTKPSFGVEYFTAFPDRTTFKRFVEDIAWRTQVWLASEPYGVVIFRKVR